MAGAAGELCKWTRAGGRVLPGLVLRREAEVALLRSKPPDS
jgi:GH24 family phage-related lysozyme (muramidase)